MQRLGPQPGPEPHRVGRTLPGLPAGGAGVAVALRHFRGGRTGGRGRLSRRCRPQAAGHNAGTFGPGRGRCRPAPPAHLLRLGSAWVGGPALAPGAVDRPRGRALAEVVAELVGAGDGAPPEPGPELVDLLVCTHGRRDTCCGARGTDLVRALAEDGPIGAGAGAGAGSAGPLGRGAGPRVRLWRTSHTGGHRFAPTALVLPPATLWAWADVALLEEVVRPAGPLSDVVSRYRGCATLGPRPTRRWKKVSWPRWVGRC